MQTRRQACQPIASLATRKRAYWAEVRSLATTFGIILAIAIIICLAAMTFLATPWFIAAAVCAAIIGPLIWVFCPDYPSQDDVENDRRLRRSAGMPDDVERD